MGGRVVKGPELHSLRVRAHIAGPAEAPEREPAVPARRAVVLRRSGDLVALVELDGAHVIAEALYGPTGDVADLRAFAKGHWPNVPPGLGTQPIVIGDVAACSKRLSNRTHRAGVPLVGFDLGPQLVGLAEHVGRGRGDGFSLALEGLRFVGRDAKTRDDMDRGRLRLTPGPEAGTFARWTTPRDRAGSGAAIPAGSFVDLRQLVGALAGGDPEDASNACAKFGVEWPAGIVDNRERVRAEANALADLYLAARGELHELAPGLAPARVWSGGSLAAHIFESAGVLPWQAKASHLPGELHGAMASSFRGGRTEARLVGVATPMVLLDITATYPSVFSLLSLTDLLAAGRVDALDMTGELRTFLGAPDLHDQLYDRKTWDRFGATFAVVMPRGEVLPATVEWGPHQVRGTVAPLDMDGSTMAYHWCDLAGAVIEGGKAPEIVNAWQIAARPGAPSDGLRPVRLPSGAEVDLASGDLGAGFLAERERWRGDDSATGRRRLAMAKGVDVAACFGQLARLDVHQRSRAVEVVGIGPGGEALATTTTRPEHPGPWCALPLASAVCAGARLLVALAVRAVSDAGGVVAHIATDSVAVSASPDGGVVPCPGAPADRLRLLTWAGCRAIVKRFEALGIRWKPEAGTLDAPTTGLVCGVNKLILGRSDADGELQVVRSSDTDFGYLCDPSGTGERLDDGRMAWVAEVQGVILRAAVSGTHYDLSKWDAIPAIRPWTPTTWSDLEAMRAELGRPDLRPYMALRRALTSGRNSGPVAVDDGSGPDGWAGLDWRRRGEPVAIGKRDDRYGQVPFRGSGSGFGSERPRVRALSVAEHVGGWLLDNDASTAGPDRGLREPAPVRSGAGLIGVFGKDGPRLDAAEDDTDSTDQLAYGSAGLADLRARVERAGVPAVAAASGVSERALRYLLDGTTRAPTASTVNRIADALAGLDAGRGDGSVPRCAAPGCERPSRPAPSITCGEPCRKAYSRFRLAAEREPVPEDRERPLRNDAATERAPEHDGCRAIVDALAKHFDLDPSQVRKPDAFRAAVVGALDCLGSPGVVVDAVASLGALRGSRDRWGVILGRLRRIPDDVAERTRSSAVQAEARCRTLRARDAKRGAFLRRVIAGGDLTMDDAEEVLRSELAGDPERHAVALAALHEGAMAALAGGRS